MLYRFFLVFFRILPKPLPVPLLWIRSREKSGHVTRGDRKQHCFFVEALGKQGECGKFTILFYTSKGYGKVKQTWLLNTCACSPPCSVPMYHCPLCDQSPPARVCVCMCVYVSPITLPAAGIQGIKSTISEIARKKKKHAGREGC